MKALIFLLLCSVSAASVQRIVLVEISSKPNISAVEKLLAEGWLVKIVAANTTHFVFVLETTDAAEAKRLAFEKRRREHLEKLKTPVEGK